MKLKLSEVVAKYGNVAIDEAKFKEVLGVKESKVWKPKSKELYWYISPSGNLNNSIFSDYRTDIKQFEIGNIYKTKEEAEFARDKQIFLTKFERYLRDNEDELVDWSSDIQKKYCVAFDTQRECAYVDNWANTIFQGTIFTTNENALEQFIKDNESDIKKYMFVIV